MEWLKPYNIILASQSPRRQELMRQAGFQFEVRVADIDEENYPADLEVTSVPGYLARQKAEKIFDQEPDHEKLVVIAADSLVFLGGRIFSKPLNHHRPLCAFRLFL
jgi:septum formation protein